MVKRWLQLAAVLAALSLAPSAPAQNVRTYPPSLPGSSGSGTAPAGSVGEVIAATRAAGSNLGLTTSTVANIVSVSLTPGHWHCGGSASFGGNAPTVVKWLAAAIETANNSMTEAQSGYVAFAIASTAIFGGGGPHIVLTLPPREIYLAATTSMFLNVDGIFTTDVLVSWGGLSCLRVQ